MIENIRDREKQLTVHILSGEISIQDLIDAVKQLYDSAPTPNHLWDLTAADMSKIEGEELQDLANFAKQASPSRVGGRTALVDTRDLGFGLSRMYRVFAEVSDQRVEIGVFRSREEAEKWIGLA